MPGRLRRLWLAVGMVAALAVIGFVVFRTATAGQTFDPALDSNVAPEDTSGVDPTEGGLPGDG